MFGGEAPFDWQITTGSLPPGLSLDSSSGQISGIPTVGGSWQFTLVVEGSRVRSYSSEQEKYKRFLTIDVM